MFLRSLLSYCHPLRLSPRFYLCFCIISVLLLSPTSFSPHFYLCFYGHFCLIAIPFVLVLASTCVSVSFLSYCYPLPLLVLTSTCVSVSFLSDCYPPPLLVLHSTCVSVSLLSYCHPLPLLDHTSTCVSISFLSYCYPLPLLVLIITCVSMVTSVLLPSSTSFSPLFRTCVSVSLLSYCHLLPPLVLSSTCVSVSLLSCCHPLPLRPHFYLCFCITSVLLSPSTPFSPHCATIVSMVISVIPCLFFSSHFYLCFCHHFQVFIRHCFCCVLSLLCACESSFLLLPLVPSTSVKNSTEAWCFFINRQTCDFTLCEPQTFIFVLWKMAQKNRYKSYNLSTCIW